MILMMLGPCHLVAKFEPVAVARYDYVFAGNIHHGRTNLWIIR